MKKPAVILLLFLLVVPAAYCEVALPPLVKQPEEVPLREKQARLEYLRGEIKRLSRQVRRVRRSQRQPIIDKMNAYQNEIDQLLKVAPPPPLQKSTVAAQATEPPPPPPPPRIEALQKLRREAFRPRNPQLGISAGYFAGSGAIRLEARFFEPFNVFSTSARAAVAVVSGPDSDGNNRNNLLLCLDGLYRFNQPYDPGFHYYTGVGANLTALTTGRTSGSFGGEIFLGADTDLWGGQVFLEAGLGLVRTGFGPRHSGAILQLGFRN